MKAEVGSFTLSDGGPYSFQDATLQAKLIVFVAGKDSTTGSNLSIGASDGTNERCLATLADTPNKTDFEYTKALLHYLNVSGTATKKLDASGVDLSVTGEFSFTSYPNVDASIPIMFIALGE